MRIKLGGLLTEAAGKIGGQIIQGGRSGLQMRNLTQPRKRSSAISTPPKAMMGLFSRAWSQIDPGDRDAWNTAALSITRYNKFGDPYTPTGYQYFMELNLAAQYPTRGIFFQTPPVVANPDPIDTIVLTADSGVPTYTITWNDILGLDEHDVLLLLYPLTRAGRDAQYMTPVYTGLHATTGAESINFASYIASTYPALDVTGYRLTAALKVVATAHGTQSPLYVVDTVIT